MFDRPDWLAILENNSECGSAKTVFESMTKDPVMTRTNELQNYFSLNFEINTLFKIGGLLSATAATTATGHTVQCPASIPPLGR